jgi:Ig-like domain from next to BRCA1 gene
MFDLRMYKTFALLISFTILVSACGPSQESAIATSVVQTVQAGESLTEVARSEAAVPTNTPEAPNPQATLTSAITPTSAATLVSAPADPNCVKATLVSENPPDSVLMKPGEYFWKTWTLQNNGTCTWNSSYELIFWSGELMGGLTSYQLPVEVGPNEQKDISIYLQAPATEGTFTGYWRIQTPWESNFGVGPSDEPFYVEVVVSTAAKPKYTVTSVTYELVRNPPMGCPTNVRYEVFATITTNGPSEVDYFWDQSDGNESGSKPIDFTEAGSVTVSREWMVGKGDSPNPRWMQIVVTEPTYQEFGKVEILNNCP